MNPVELIKKKRRGDSLTPAELKFMVEGYTLGKIPDYQMSAFLMATLFKGMSDDETAQLVDLMLHSGAVVNLDKVKTAKVDKHSTGGIGDKTTFLLAPILASLGYSYPTIAGRSLGHTGGTVDKLESIPGFQCHISLKRFQELVGSVGLAFLGQTDEICPADKKIYGLRDVTGTVESLPLIVASIMSKKLAEGAEGLVFDVKCGSGAFMKTDKEAEALAKALVATAKRCKRKAQALVTTMNGPLGHGVGNAIEINECVAFLRQGPADQPPEPELWNLTLELSAALVAVAEETEGAKPSPKKEVLERIEAVLRSGQAYSKFLEVVSLQGGDTEALDQGLPLAPKSLVVEASEKGYVSEILGESVGQALVELGGGRKKAGEPIDHGVGFWFEKREGQAVDKGEALVRIFARDLKTGELAKNMLIDAIRLSPRPPSKANLIRTRF
jgi:pyrimidine-nucleoside phosphorylase